IDIVIFRRALRPLLNASEMAKKINPKRTDVRLPPEEIPKEILPLVQAVNQALDRLEAGFRVQRAFTAARVHELRTPLTTLRPRAAASPRRPLAELHKRGIKIAKAWLASSAKCSTSRNWTRSRSIRWRKPICEPFAPRLRSLPLRWRWREARISP